MKMIRKEITILSSVMLVLLIISWYVANNAVYWVDGIIACERTCQERIKPIGAVRIKNYE